MDNSNDWFSLNFFFLMVNLLNHIKTNMVKLLFGKN